MYHGVLLIYYILFLYCRRLTFGADENLTLVGFYDCWNNLLPHMKQPYLFTKYMTHKQPDRCIYPEFINSYNTNFQSDFDMTFSAFPHDAS